MQDNKLESLNTCHDELILKNHNKATEQIACNSKISIIGTGSVGATTAYALMLRNIAKEIILIDIDEKRCAGEILDLSDALSFCRTTKIRSGTFEDAKSSNIIIICAGAKQVIGQPREQLLATNKKVITEIIEKINPVNPNAIILMVTNPMDIMTYFAQKASNLPKERVFGTGTFLDTQRLRRLISEQLHVADQSVHAYIIGEHGDSQIAAWSTANIAGKPLLEFPELSKEILEDFANQTKNKVYKIIKCKGATFFGIAACVSAICENILFDRKYVLPLSVYLQEFDVCMSLPVELGANGIEKIIQIPLDKHELELLKISSQKIREIIEKS